MFNIPRIQRHYIGGWLYDFENPKHPQTRRSATTQLQTTAIEVCKGQAAAARQMAQGAAASLRITAVLCVCARAKLRPNLETISGE